MNATEMLDNSHLMIIQAVDHLPELEWDVPEVCGEWSVKEIIAHLTSYECVLVDVLNTFLGHAPTAYISRFMSNIEEFNNAEVEKLRYETAQRVMDEYNDVQVQSVSLLAQIPPSTVRQTGTMPWYGKDRCLNDLIIVFYDHACEHCAQIGAFREKSKG